jgi:hypothetical protein
MATARSKAPKNPRKTINHMGASAYKHTDKEALAEAIATTFMEDAYYETAAAFKKRLSSLMDKVDPVFAAKAAVYVRTEMNMRAVYGYMISKLANLHVDNDVLYRSITSGVTRLDDILEIASNYADINGGNLRPMPKGMKNGFRDKLSETNAFLLAKYKATGDAITMKDIVRLVHPRPHDSELNQAFKDLVSDNLKNKDTWEAKMSAGGGAKETFGDLLRQKKLGYMACLRNLRNILETGDSDVIRMALKFIANPKAVAGSKQLPFRFLSAYKAIEGEMGKKKGNIVFENDAGVDKTDVLAAIETALDHSCDNLPDFDGSTAVLVDNSGSMRGDRGGNSAVSAMSSVNTAAIANLFAVMTWKKSENTYIGLFGDRLIAPKLNRKEGLFANYDTLNREAYNCGGGTETGIFRAFRSFIDEKVKPSRIIIFSDCQIGTGCAWYDTKGNRGPDFNKLFQEFRKMSPDTIVYTVSLRGYGDTVMSDGLVKLAGWSNNIFDAIRMQEDGTNLVKLIDNIQI